MEENIDADDPYDVLGISREATEDEVKSHACELLDTYSDDHAARTTIMGAFVEIMERPTPVEVGDTTVVPLLVSASPDTIEVGEEVTLRVTDHRDEPVPDARIRVEGQSRGRSDDDGRETLRLNDAGFVEITAQIRHPKPGYEFSKGRVDVVVEENSR